MRSIALLPGILLLSGVAAAAPVEEPAAEASLAPLPAAEWSYAAAAHLLRRAGFSGTPAEVRALHALGLDGAVDRLLGWEGRPDPRLPSPGITVTSRPGRAEMMAAADREARQRIQRDWRRKDLQQFQRIREWWIQSMIRTDWPLRERMVLFWHGHFTSSQRDVRNSYHMYVQNTLLRRHAAGNFRTLLHEISKDPAMLEYLDNNRNRKAHPNENFAREVMELFTLGVGNYTESDIKELARALTGWTFLGNRFFFDRRQHDDGVKTIFGRRGNFDGDQALDVILSQPAASRFLAAKLFRYFAHDAPAPDVVKGLASTLRKHNWELKPMLRQLFLSRAFYAPRAVGSRIKGPVELLVMLFKSLDMDPRQARGASLLAQMLGQGLLDPPNVKGWPGGRDWITTSHLLNRYNLAGALVGLPQDKVRVMRGLGGRVARMMRQMQRRRVDPNGEEMEGMAGGMAGGEAGGMAGDRDDPRERRGRRRGLASYDVVARTRALGLEAPDRIVDHYTQALLANPAGAEIRKTLLDYLTRDGGFDLDAEDARERLHGLLRLIVSTPEFQLH